MFGITDYTIDFIFVSLKLSEELGCDYLPASIYPVFSSQIFSKGTARQEE